MLIQIIITQVAIDVDISVSLQQAAQHHYPLNTARYNQLIVILQRVACKTLLARIHQLQMNLNTC